MSSSRRSRVEAGRGASPVRPYLIVHDCGPVLRPVLTQRGDSRRWRLSRSKRQRCRRILALVHGRQVASMCYEVPYRRVIKDRGTFVSPAHRQRGLARLLWVTMIRREKPRAIMVTPISDRGLTLVASLRASYRNILWHVEEQGDRKLRVMRKAS